MKYLLPMILMFSCVQSEEPKVNTRLVRIKFQDHNYLFYDRFYGCALIHDPECPCMKGPTSATHEQGKGMNGPNKPKGN